MLQYQHINYLQVCMENIYYFDIVCVRISTILAQLCEKSKYFYPPKYSTTIDNVIIFQFLFVHEYFVHFLLVIVVVIIIVVVADITQVHAYLFQPFSKDPKTPSLFFLFLL